MTAPVGDHAEGEELYRAPCMSARSTALCLSGGGIRSASFALGVIEALAVHPRPATNASRRRSEDKSLLRQFNYLSTVSGGGYIGSWLSAWIARAGFPEVWKSSSAPPASGRGAVRDRVAALLQQLPDAQNRAVLGRHLGRDRALCAQSDAELAGHPAGAVPRAVRREDRSHRGILGLVAALTIPRWFIVAGVIAMVIALRSALLYRPSRDPGTIKSGASEAYGRHNHPAGMRDPHHNETARTRSGADEAKFIRRCLIPAVLAAFLISIYLLMRGPRLAEWGLFKAAAVSLVAGMGIYALAWISAWPPKTWVPHRDLASGRTEGRGGLYWARDFASWVAAGGVYGAMIGVGIHTVAEYPSWSWLLIGNADVDHATAVFLLSFIYGVPWIIMAQLIAEMIFVGLTSWQPYSDSDREWFGRSTGWFGGRRLRLVCRDVSGARRGRVRALARRRIYLGKIQQRDPLRLRRACSARCWARAPRPRPRRTPSHHPGRNGRCRSPRLCS